MAWLNSAEGYGTGTKILHWLVVLIFALQLTTGHTMVRLDAAGTAIGFSQDTYFNFHKSIGLIALVIAIIRIVVRNKGQLPAWAPTLSGPERRFVHRAEQFLYLAMFVLPVSGFIYVMTGGYGVLLFGLLELPNPIGISAPSAIIAKWVHILSGFALVAVLAGHVGLVLWHQIFIQDGLLYRMLPGRSKSDATDSSS